MSNLFAVFISDDNNLNGLIMFEAVCLSVENVEVLGVGLLLYSLSPFVVRFLLFLFFLRNLFPWDTPLFSLQNFVLGRILEFPISFVNTKIQSFGIIVFSKALLAFSHRF